MFLRKLLILNALLLSSFPLIGEGTRTWEQSKYEDFLKGTTHGVAISSDGTLELAPGFRLVASVPSSALWATAVGPQGEIYAATGAPARVYRIAPGGQPVAIFQPQELQVQALVVDKNGVIYAATNPDGKVYRLEHGAASGAASVTSTTNGKGEKPRDEKSKSASEWTSSVYFDPGTKYIWALALDSAGALYVATGDHGEIFRVSPDGQHSVFFKSDEPHMRVLAFDVHGDLIAGSDGSGLIYRINPKGDGFVLYSAPKREITSLALDSAGNIYAAAAGEKHSGSGSASVSVAVPNPPAAQPASPAPGLSVAPGPPPESTVTVNNSSAGTPNGSEIYKISPDGSPSRLWNSRDQLVYSLAFDANGHLLAGTGNKGQIFEISARDSYTELIKAEANQITAFTRAPSGGIYASTSNLGKIFLLSSTSDAEGTYESDVFDAKVFSRWGRAEFRGSGNVEPGAVAAVHPAPQRRRAYGAPP